MSRRSVSQGSNRRKGLQSFTAMSRAASLFAVLALSLIFAEGPASAKSSANYSRPCNQSDVRGWTVAHFYNSDTKIQFGLTAYSFTLTMSYDAPKGARNTVQHVVFNGAAGFDSADVHLTSKPKTFHFTLYGQEADTSNGSLEYFDVSSTRLGGAYCHPSSAHFTAALYTVSQPHPAS